MRRLTTVLTAAAVLAGTAVAAPAVAAPGDVQVAGRITSASGEPIAGVQVTVYTTRDGHRVPFRATTGARGRYRIALPASDHSYLLKVTDHGDADHDDGDGTWAPVLRAFDVDGTASEQDQVLQRGAGVTGRILGRDGKPVRAGLRVTAFGPTSRTVTRTRADGRYRFRNLQAGGTTVLAESPGGWGRDRWWAADVPEGSVGRGTRFGLEAGDRTVGVDIAFPPVGKITGRVRVDGQEPWSEGTDGVDVVLVDAAGRDVATYWSHPAFRIWDVPPGTYTLRFEAPAGATGARPVTEWWRDAATSAGATRITIRSGSAVTGLVADLATG